MAQIKKDLILDLLRQVRSEDSGENLGHLKYSEKDLEDIACNHVLAMHLAQKREGLSVEDREAILLAICAGLCIDLTIAKLKQLPSEGGSKEELTKLIGKLQR